MQRQATRLGTQRPLPGAPFGPVGTIRLTAAVAPDLPTYCGWRPSEALGDLPPRPAHRNATGNLFALLKPQSYHGSAPWRRSNPSMESHDLLDAGLVPSFQRPRDSRSTLPVPPALPQFSLLFCREPNP